MSIGQLLIMLLVLPLFLVMSLFMMSFILDIGVNELFPIVDNTTKQVSSNMGLDNTTNETINQISDDADTLPKAVNYIFTGMILGLIIGMMLVSLFSERLPGFSFLTLLTIGSMVFNLALSIFGSLTDWFINEILLSVIELNMNYPIISFYFENFQALHFFMFVICLALNQIDLAALRANTQKGTNI